MAVDPDDQLIADVSGTIEVLTEMLVPNQGDEATVELFGDLYTITNSGSYSYSD
jgi:hypothetical protein